MSGPAVLAAPALPARLRAVPLLAVPSHAVRAELAKRRLYTFLQEFWETIIPDAFVPSWHIEYLCDEIEEVFRRVQRREPKEYDLVINVPPGTTKSTVAVKMFPVWAWVNDPELSFITGSYSADLALEHADLSRDIINSPKFKLWYPDRSIRYGQDSKGKYQVAWKKPGEKEWRFGGKRYATSVGGTILGMHGHIIIVDDPIKPSQADASSPAQRQGAKDWMDRTLSTRKTDKALTPLILIMQRLHQNDPTGHHLSKKIKIRHINLPGRLSDDPMIKVQPPELEALYVDGLLDPERLPASVLTQMEAELGQYGFSGQVLQHPVPPGGGMFKPDNLIVLTASPSAGAVKRKAIYWDKAGTPGGGAFTVGLEMWELRNAVPKYVIVKITRGQWGSHERERMILEEAERAGRGTTIIVEQEPGSGGKESAEATIRNLAGHHVKADRPTGDKVYRADPLSVQVNGGNVGIVNGPWLKAFIDEMRFFPLGMYKDQIDAASGAFNFLVTGKRVGAW